MSKTENTFNPSRCIFHIGTSSCRHARHPNHNKGKCPCEEAICPSVVSVLTRPPADEKAPSAVELTDEIKSFRQKNKEFQSTNDHETYLIVCFSTKEDKKTFLKNSMLEGKHTLIDGYELARNLDCEPRKPGFELREPIGD